MFDVSFEFNGKKIRPGEIGKSLESAIESAMLKAVRDHVTKAVGSVRCSVHGQGAKVIVTGRDLKHLEFKVSGCCQDLIDKVKQKLK
jgi:hypothetical protein